jgi:hypothetical protein
MQSLQNLINFYTQLVEQYDKINDPIKIYFLEKLHIVYFQKKALGYLFSTNS